MFITNFQYSFCDNSFILFVTFSVRKRKNRCSYIKMEILNKLTNEKEYYNFNF